MPACPLAAVPSRRSEVRTEWHEWVAGANRSLVWDHPTAGHEGLRPSGPDHEGSLEAYGMVTPLGEETTGVARSVLRTLRHRAAVPNSTARRAVIAVSGSVGGAHTAEGAVKPPCMVRACARGRPGPLTDNCAHPSAFRAVDGAAGSARAGMKMSAVDSPTGSRIDCGHVSRRPPRVRG